MTPIQKVDLILTPPDARLLRALQPFMARAGSALRVALDVLDSDPTTFFALAAWNGTATWPERANEVAAVVRVLGEAVRRGYSLTGEGAEVCLRVTGAEESLVRFEASERERLELAVSQLDGRTAVMERRRDPGGTDVTTAEVDFALGSEAELLHVRRRVQSHADAVPNIFRLHDRDVRALSKHPPWVVHELQHNVRRVVHAPNAVFRGLRAEGEQRGLAFCGQPSRAFGNDGSPANAPHGKVFVAFVTDDNFLFDWDWLEADHGNPRLPIHWRQRFGERIDPPYATVEGIEGIIPGTLDRTEASYSFKGDCVFYYFNDEPAIAERVDDDLTLFKGRDSGDRVGLKVKNVRMLVENHVTARGEVSVGVHTILAFAMLRQFSEDQRRFERYRDLMREVVPGVSFLPLRDMGLVIEAK